MQIIGTKLGMCGIFFYTGKSDMGEEFTYKGLKKLEYRGYDSFGVGGINNTGHVHLQKFIGKVSDEKNESKFRKNNCGVALGHTRWATHDKVNIDNAHPHLIT
jgi:glucosamine--fructose-6-phosphate aminotransferase (isomerizing)